MLLRARDKAKELGQLRNSITKGAGNLVGFVGEEIAYAVLYKAYKRVRFVNNYDYDILVDGWRVDVKTKATSVKPLSSYQCSVSALNTKQACDVYAFVRVKNDLTVGWWCGNIAKDRFFNKAVFCKKGSDDNGYVFKSDCYNVPIKDLKLWM